MSESNRLTVLSLFSGAGGLDKGFEEAGFRILWANDKDENCRETYEKNFDAELHVGDIQEMDFPDLGLEKGELDMIIGGPPCPTFSLVGRAKINSIDGRHVTEDERHALYVDFLQFVNRYRPKAFLMENVRGMLSAENAEGKNVARTIKKEMESLGYRVKLQCVDAANYGVPQHRERVFFIGNRLGKENPDLEEWQTHRPPKDDKEKKMRFRRGIKKDKNQKKISEYSREGDRSFPVFKKNIKKKKPWVTVGEAILDLPPVVSDGETPPTRIEEYTVPALTEYQHWARNIPEGKTWEEVKLHNHECRGHNMRDLTIYKILGEGVGWILGELPEEVQPYRTDIFPDKFKKQNPREPSSTIVAHLYKDGHMFIHPREARSITPREAARLQSFRDTFKFPEARTHAYKQIGNAVPPLLAQAIATAIRREIFEKE